MDMTLGVPSASLRPLGLTDLPLDYVFPIAVRGTSAQPQIDFVRCAPGRASASRGNFPIDRCDCKNAHILVLFLLTFWSPP